ncbi:MAG: hypothetical protein A3D65_03025 [Candidatus Lloydbacteria bacterium RIFCSPHIGHO2_02_FULL_50_13]|uniref:Uncharacterized protein n=1 Tax=Candidatus Lloydbacteria bacterium RIFCSPHIGHO2_02_FULL_50_13 TaxID=1798661 RepID=A0A1G2D4P2_9BACT|nr:MAG: hypothetical protein A3D65_03025 [Candidatus Lloydbacteria bacterium RIFCSPHIGHO2_02_FULL_50_13]
MPLIDFTLKDGTVVKEVSVADSEEIIFSHGMRTFTDSEIASVALSVPRVARITHTYFKVCLKLTDKTQIGKISSFPEHGMGYSLVDVTLFDGTIVEQAPICDDELVRFYDDMPIFAEADIASVACSKI